MAKKSKKENDKTTKRGPNSGFPYSGEEIARSEAIRELLNVDEDELPIKTETSPRMVITFAILKTVQEGLILGRKRRLSEIYQVELDKRMISKSRKGRGELVVALSSGKAEEEGELRL